MDGRPPFTYFLTNSDLIRLAGLETPLSSSIYLTGRKSFQHAATISYNGGDMIYDDSRAARCHHLLLNDCDYSYRSLESHKQCDIRARHKPMFTAGSTGTS
jgi:hypothetical protein